MTYFQAIRCVQSREANPTGNRLTQDVEGGDRVPDADIANVREDNSKAIRGVCRGFVVLCQLLGLFRGIFDPLNGHPHPLTVGACARKLNHIGAYALILDFPGALAPANRESQGHERS